VAHNFHKNLMKYHEMLCLSATEY